LPRTPELFAPPVRWLHDTGTLAILALVVVPFYLLLNQYWQSIFQLILVYGLLSIGFFRLGRYIRRVLQRTPAEIPPWYGAFPQAPILPLPEVQIGAVEAIRSVHQDPYYWLDVMKPRLCQLLAYRVSGMPDASLATLTPAQLARVDPVVLAALQRRNATGLWAKYCYRKQRVQETLAILRYLEAL
jgi:hypothetical protein